MMVSGAAQIVLSTRSQHDLTVTDKEAEGTRLRLDDVDLHALQPRHVIRTMTLFFLGFSSRLILTQPARAAARAARTVDP